MYIYIYKRYSVCYLSCSRFTGNKNRLVDSISEHRSVGSIRDSKDVGGYFASSLSLVEFDDGGVVDGQHFVGIDYYQEQSRVGLGGT